MAQAASKLRAHHPGASSEVKAPAPKPQHHDFFFLVPRSRIFTQHQEITGKAVLR